MSMLFKHWFEDEWEDPPLPEAGIGMFAHWFENEPEEPYDVSMFSHWFENHEPIFDSEKRRR